MSRCVRRQFRTKMRESANKMSEGGSTSYERIGRL